MNDGPKRTIVVTGGTKGIGRAICRAFAGAETCVFFNYASSGPDAAATEDAVLQAGGQAIGIRADLTSESEMTAFFKDVTEQTGRIDVLVNNAGIAKDGLLPRMKTRDWDAVMDVNLKGTFLCTRLASRTMIGQKSGRIINMTSLAGIAGNPGQANYAASKAGIVGLTKSAARELASRHITVNAIAPGYIETDMTSHLPESKKAEILSQIPMGRAGTPEEVASVALFLASDAARYITGQVIHVNGGMYT